MFAPENQKLFTHNFVEQNKIIYSDIFLDVAARKKFPVLSLVWYLFTVVSGNRYLTRGSNGNVLTTSNIFVYKYIYNIFDGYYQYHDSLNSVKAIWRKLYSPC